MNIRAATYKRHRFPPDIIQYAVWLYFRFNLSHRDIEDLLAQRGIEASRESIRLWSNKFGPRYVRRLRRAHGGYGDTFFIDEVFVKIQGVQWIRMAKSLMCFYRHVEMARPQGVSSSVCSSATRTCHGRS